VSTVKESEFDQKFGAGGRQGLDALASAVDCGLLAVRKFDLV